MPSIQFQGLNESLSRVPQVLQSIPDIIRNPVANPLQAAILLSMVVVLVLIVLLSVVFVLLRPGADDALYAEEGEEGQEYAEGGPVEPTSSPMSWITVSAIILLVVAAVIVAAGISSGSNSVCVSCHTDTEHSAASGSDPHKDTSCVACHEDGGPVARVTIDMAGRVEHFVLALTNPDAAKGYGKPVASDACARCHSAQLQGTVYDKTTSIKMSHKEPLAAGAQCVYCHTLNFGVVDSTTVGMSPCLRCHNGKTAKIDCNECHVGDPARGIASVDASQAAGIQVPNPQCDGCHWDMTRCNNCHGISMPHSDAFKQYGHARPGAMDIWFNNGRVCGKCHYPGHNYCVQPGCHYTYIPGGHPNPAWATLHSHAGWYTSQSGCSCHGWNPYDHNGQVYCQICHATRPKGVKN